MSRAWAGLDRARPRCSPSWSGGWATGPFLDGVRTVDGRALAAAAGLAVLTTVCCAWRWKIVARGLGVDLPLPAAVAAYYRSQFLNVTLPGRHRGRRPPGDQPRSRRERCRARAAGRRLGALRRARSSRRPDRRRAPRAAVAGALVDAVGGDGAVVAVVVGAPAFVGAAGDCRSRRGAWLGVTLASALVVCGHAATFLIAAQTAGATAPLSQLLPLALIAMLAMVLPW